MLTADELVTERLRLRPLTEPGADVMVDVLNDEQMHMFTGGRLCRWSPNLL